MLYSETMHWFNGLQPQADWPIIGTQPGGFVYTLRMNILTGAHPFWRIARILYLFPNYHVLFTQILQN
jgi:hypothetical protein